MAIQQGADPNPSYWAAYSNLQHVKHELIKEYLNGWFPKLGLWAGRIVYFDTHAGRGTHAQGQLGSPLIALNTFLEHKSRDKILEKSEVTFFFIERDEENASLLRDELSRLGTLPAKITCRPIVADCFLVLQELIAQFRASGRNPAPAFFFIDPYGFNIPGSVLRDLMGFERVELFINVIWRELNMAISQGERMADTLDTVFDGGTWRDAITSEDIDERADQAVNLLRTMTEAKWPTYCRMLGDNNVTRYLLLHLTNSDAGRDLMKDCIWKVRPDGKFYVRKSDDPSQQYLIEPEPDLTPLRTWILDKLRTNPFRWKVLADHLRAEVWREPHLNKAISELRKGGRIEGDQYEGRFCKKSNPRLFLCP
ncbi:MAG: three-Cys-motif partner protein TcmP [bacterium]|nr:three-Cys-motif partner protein TcmP [bacterium]